VNILLVHHLFLIGFAIHWFGSECPVTGLERGLLRSNGLNDALYIMINVNVKVFV